MLIHEYSTINKEWMVWPYTDKCRRAFHKVHVCLTFKQMCGILTFYQYTRN